MNEKDIKSWHRVLNLKEQFCVEEDLKMVMIITIILRLLVEITLQTNIRAIIL